MNRAKNVTFKREAGGQKILCTFFEKLKLQSELNLREDAKIVLLINSPMTVRLGEILANYWDNLQN